MTPPTPIAATPTGACPGENPKLSSKVGIHEISA